MVAPEKDLFLMIHLFMQRAFPTLIRVGRVHAVTVAAVRAAGHVPHLAVLLPARAAPQPPRLLELFVKLVDVNILHHPFISSETLVYISIGQLK